MNFVHVILRIAAVVGAVMRGVFSSMRCFVHRPLTTNKEGVMKSLQMLFICVVFSIAQVAVVAHAEEVKLTASDGAAGDYFGRSVSISGDYAIVGAFVDDHAGGDYAGSAYIFVRNGNSWTQQAKLTATDAAEGDSFGVSVSISGDYAIVGSYCDDHAGGDVSGSAYIFHRSGATWIQQAKLTASDAAAYDKFGRSVSISGGYAIVGSYYDDDAGSAYVFVRSGETWTEQAKLTASDAAEGDAFGVSVSISGSYAIVAATEDDDGGESSGSAYIFVRSGTSWSQQAKLMASDAAEGDAFGISVSISGSYAIVGAQGDPQYAARPGSAYIFVRSGTSWTEQAKLTASDAAEGDAFGMSVSISGDYAIVGAEWDDDDGNMSGSAYSFLRSGSAWSQKAKITASDAEGWDHFGISVSISDDYAIVGAYADDHHGQEDAGAAYIYHSIEDLALPVELAVFTARPGDGEVTLHWVTESETDNLGFHVYRALSEGGEYQRLTAELIAGAGNTTTEQTYTFTDIRLTNGVTYWYKVEDVAFDGTRTMHGPISVTPQAKAEVVVFLPEKYAVSPCYPNPFNPITTIRYQLPEPGNVRLTIYDVLGQEVRVLVSGLQSAGWYGVMWDGKDKVGQLVSSGVYLYRLEVEEEFLQTRKMMVVR